MKTAEKKFSQKDELALIKLIWSPEWIMYPEKFVLGVFPWGVAGTPLANREPRKWQLEELQGIGEHNIANQSRLSRGLLPTPYNVAIASGRGIGKSALVSWLALWSMSTRVGSATVITANTESQLMSKTWPELGKWHNLMINNHWFERTATTIRPSNVLDLKKTGIDKAYYYIQAQLWSEENPDAFAGLHNDNGLCLIFDEASGIPKSIWDVSEGFFTEPIFLRLWIVFSNPRRPSGEFYECFHKSKAYWHTRHIDARDVEGTDPKVYEKLIAKHGEDSDVAKVEVKGQFPSQGSNQLISAALVDRASERHIDINDVVGSPKILGVDVARYGDDSSVLQKRQGLLAHEPQDFSKLDNMTLAGIIASVMEEWEADACMIGSGGASGVIDRLRQLGWSVIEVQEGGIANKPKIYLNKRIEIWEKADEWLKAGGVIPNHDRLKQDLKAPEYKYTENTNKKVLESVESMKDRGLPSPDFGTALALTFSYDVTSSGRGKNKGKNLHEYDVFQMRNIK